jgi:hypothetical protein
MPTPLYKSANTSAGDYLEGVGEDALTGAKQKLLARAVRLLLTLPFRKRYRVVRIGQAGEKSTFLSRYP